MLPAFKALKALDLLKAGSPTLKNRETKAIF